MSITNRRRGDGQSPIDATPSSTAEPCAGCSEETAAGSVFFSDRLAVSLPGGGQGFLCSECRAKARAAK